MQQPLAVFDPGEGATELSVEFRKVVGGTVRQTTLGVGPNELGRMELRIVGGERIDVEPRWALQEVAYQDSPMDRAPIPQKHDWTAPRAQEIAEEIPDLHPRNVGPMKLHPQSQALAMRRNGESGDRRDPMP